MKRTPAASGNASGVRTDPEWTGRAPQTVTGDGAAVNSPAGENRART